MKRPAAILIAGLVLRLAATAYLARVMPHMLSWGVNEVGGIVRWIVINHTFSSPFHDAHGPTAWIAPIYPRHRRVYFRCIRNRDPNLGFSRDVF